MQVIPQNEYLIDGLPASRCGEWPGIKSNKWQGSIRVIRSKDHKNLLNGKKIK